jgi:hypothetical protein
VAGNTGIADQGILGAEGTEVGAAKADHADAQENLTGGETGLRSGSYKTGTGLLNEEGFSCPDCRTGRPFAYRPKTAKAASGKLAAFAVQ